MILFLFSMGCGTYLFMKRDGVSFNSMLFYEAAFIHLCELIQIDNEVADALNYMVQHYYQGAGVIQEALDNLQQAVRCHLLYIRLFKTVINCHLLLILLSLLIQFRCCGNGGCGDFTELRLDIPRSCDIMCDVSVDC